MRGDGGASGKAPAGGAGERGSGEGGGCRWKVNAGGSWIQGHRWILDPGSNIPGPGSNDPVVCSIPPRPLAAPHRHPPRPSPPPQLTVRPGDPAEMPPPPPSPSRHAPNTSSRSSGSEMPSSAIMPAGLDRLDRRTLPRARPAPGGPPGRPGDEELGAPPPSMPGRYMPEVLRPSWSGVPAPGGGWVTRGGGGGSSR